MPEHIRFTRNRRGLLSDAFCGFGALAYSSMLYAGDSKSSNPLAPKPPQMPAKAKSVIFLFMAGGPSHLETFDPKPLLNKLDGQKRPAEFGEAKYQFVTTEAKILGPNVRFRSMGKPALRFRTCCLTRLRWSTSLR